jgi:hypothetical protein
MYRALSTSSRLLEPDEVGGKERLGKDMMQVKQQWKKMLSTLCGPKDQRDRGEIQEMLQLPSSTMLHPQSKKVVH